MAEARHAGRRRRSHRLHCRRGALAGSVPARLPDRLHVLAGPEPGLSGAADGAVSFRRLLGIVHPPRAGSVEQMPAADVRVVPADSVWTASSLPVDERSGSHRAQPLVSAYWRVRWLVRPLDHLLRDLDWLGHGAEQARRPARQSAAGRDSAALPGTERLGTGALFLVAVVCGCRLGDVARSALGLDHLRPHLSLPDKVCRRWRFA